MIKRFLVFAYDTCYPCGGWHDFAGSADTGEGAIHIADTMSNTYLNVYIVDTQTGQQTCYQSP